MCGLNIARFCFHSLESDQSMFIAIFEKLTDINYHIIINNYMMMAQFSDMRIKLMMHL